MGDMTEYVSGGVEMLASFKGMWERLNAHHALICPDFRDAFRRRDFSWRLNRWIEEGTAGI